MENELLSFDMKIEDGQDVVCEVTTIVPNEDNPDEPYVVFTDNRLDENNNYIMQYGKLVNGQTELIIIDDEEIIRLINEAIAAESYENDNA